MNLVFLDIDGVLNSHRFLRAKAARGRYTPGAQLDPVNVGHLNDLVERMGAFIVVSSSWRNHGREKLARWLGARGLRRPLTRIVATLPSHLPHDWIEWGDEQRSGIYRGLEIEAWMLRHLDQEALDSTRIVILDDDSDFGRLRTHWVRTTLFDGPDTLDPKKYNYTGPYSGLQAGHVEQAVKLFEGQGTIGSVLATPNPHWSEKARAALYPKVLLPRAQTGS